MCTAETATLTLGQVRVGCTGWPHSVRTPAGSPHATQCGYRATHRPIGSGEHEDFVSECTVFQMLDQLCPTSTGLDRLPAWFLKLGAPLFSKPIAYLFNLSVNERFVPQQWKTAWISPIPKVSAPQSHTDYRPISITSILSRIM